MTCACVASRICMNPAGCGEPTRTGSRLKHGGTLAQPRSPLDGVSFWLMRSSRPNPVLHRLNPIPLAWFETDHAFKQIKSLECSEYLFVTHLTRSITFCDGRLSRKLCRSVPSLAGRPVTRSRQHGKLQSKQGLSSP